MYLASRHYRVSRYIVSLMTILGGNFRGSLYFIYPFIARKRYRRTIYMRVDRRHGTRGGFVGRNVGCMCRDTFPTPFFHDPFNVSDVSGSSMVFRFLVCLKVHRTRSPLERLVDELMSSRYTCNNRNDISGSDRLLQAKGIAALV